MGYVLLVLNFVGDFMKKINLFLLVFTLIFALAGCSFSDKNTQKEQANFDNQLNIVATVFPSFDFTRQIVKDRANVSMLLKPGQDAHSFDPTPSDIKNVQSADLFIYTGGENDDWIENILNSMGDKKPKTLKLLDIVNPLEDVEIDDDHDDDDDDELNEHTEIDEHVWSSPKNAILIVDKIYQLLTENETNADNINFYDQNYKNYRNELVNLDQNYENVINSSQRKPLVFGDRFPFRYLANDYNLNYFSAFSGCSDDTEASPKTISFLIDKVLENNLTTVFFIEFSNGKIADTIASATNAKKQLINSVHNVTKKQFENGATYLSLMSENLELLKEALN